MLHQKKSHLNLTLNIMVQVRSLCKKLHKLLRLLWYCIMMSPFSFRELKAKEPEYHLVRWCQSPAISLRSKVMFLD